MRFEKVIYIRYMPLTKKIYSDFYMQEVIDAGLSVEYWDITPLFFKENSYLENSSNLINTKVFNSYLEIEEQIKLEPILSKVLFVSIMTFEGRVKKLYQIFTKYNCILSVFGRNMFPVASRPRTAFGILKRFRFSYVLNYIKLRRLVKLLKQGKIKKYDYAFIGGDLGWQGIGRVTEDDLIHTKKIKVNSDDYDNYLLLKDKKFAVEHEYILFLDEYLPLHPDTILFNIKNVKAEDYYPLLNKYFDRVEKQFNMPVIIAAHPKAARYKNEDFFSGRKVVFNETAQLTNSAYFVLAHDSTSINYPICFNKKIHFITSKSIMSGIEEVHRNVIHFANYLGCNYQIMDNVDEKINLIEALPNKNYDNYKYSFQTSTETELKLTKDIFIEFLTKNDDISNIY